MNDSIATARTAAKLKRLPMMLRGKSFVTSDAVEVEFPTGEWAEVTCASPEFVTALEKDEPSGITGLKLHEITAFLYSAGKKWKSRDYSRRVVYENNLVKYFGFSPEMATNEANWIALLLTSHYRLYDQLQIELGSWQILDEWIPREESLVRAFPKGKVLHLLPGNVPLSGVVSILRGVITKNEAVVKPAAADPFTPMALALSFADVNPSHPITRSISIGYWPQGHELGDRVAAGCDAVCAWGGEEAIAWSRRVVMPGASVLEFGPKRSLAVIGANADLAAAARGVAFDMSIYDQRACFSTRQVFVHRNIAASFVAALQDHLEKLERILPKGIVSFDEAADQTLQHAHAEFLGTTFHRADDASWAIIAAPPEGGEPHCLGRTIYIHEFEDHSEIVAACDKTVQTVTIAPWDFSVVIRDGIAAVGVSRIAECGMANVFRLGGTHDGVYPLQHLVRLASNDLPSATFVKGMNIPINQTEFIEHDRFLDFIP